MSEVNVIKIYEAKSPVDKVELQRLTDEELTRLRAKSNTTVAVHVSSGAKTLTVIAIEPVGDPWDWQRDLDAFTVHKENFILRKKA